MSNKYAIVRAFGRQYMVREGEKIQGDFIEREVGSKITLSEVLFVNTGSDVKIGKPLVAGASVQATLTEHIRGDKVLVFKYLKKNKSKKLNGHRQPYSVLTIDSIGC